MINNKQDALEFLTKLIIDKKDEYTKLEWELEKLDFNKDSKKMLQILSRRRWLRTDLLMLHNSYKFISNQIPEEVREWN